MTTPPTPPPVTFGMVVLDTPAPFELATFYSALLGWDIVRVDDDWVAIKGPSGSQIGFQLAPNLVPPTWPSDEVPQQIHLDFDVADLDEGEAFALSIGARKVPGDVHQDGFRVYLDPSGHPFCLCRV